MVDNVVNWGIAGNALMMLSM